MALEVKMHAKCCRLRSWQLAPESSWLHWRRGSQREPVWLARCCPGPPRPIQVVRSSFKKSEPLCSSSSYPPGQMAALFTGQDAGGLWFWLWNLFYVLPISSPSSIKSFYYAFNLFGISELFKNHRNVTKVQGLPHVSGRSQAWPSPPMTHQSASALLCVCVSSV